MHTSSGAINLVSDSHASRYNFATLEGTLRSVPKYRPTVGAGRGSQPSPRSSVSPRIYRRTSRTGPRAGVPTRGGFSRSRGRIMRPHASKSERPGNSVVSRRATPVRFRFRRRCIAAAVPRGVRSLRTRHFRQSRCTYGARRLQQMLTPSDSILLWVISPLSNLKTPSFHD